MLAFLVCAAGFFAQQDCPLPAPSVEVVDVESPLSQEPAGKESRAEIHLQARTPGAMASFEQELMRLYEVLSPSLVEVHFTLSEGSQANAEKKERQLITSGVVLNNYGLVVVPVAFDEEQRAVLLEKIQVLRIDGKEFSAELLDWNEDYGLSLLRAKDLLGLAPSFWNGTWTQEGSLVVSLGNGFGLRSSMHLGLLTGRGRSIDKAYGLLQITNPVNLADHGGLLANRRGQVIGILMTSLAEQATVLSLQKEHKQEQIPWLEKAKRAEAVSFAVPVEIVFRIFAKYFPNQGSPRMLGVMVNSELEIIEEAGQEPSHAWRLRVTGVEAGSPADLAGMQTNDILTELNGVPTHSLQELGKAIHQAPMATTVKVLRGDQLLELPLEFED